MLLHKLFLLLGVSVIPPLMCAVIQTLARLQLSGTKGNRVPTAGGQETLLNIEKQGPFCGFAGISVIWKSSGKDLCDMSSESNSCNCVRVWF